MLSSMLRSTATRQRHVVGLFVCLERNREAKRRESWRAAPRLLQQCFSAPLSFYSLFLKIHAIFVSDNCNILTCRNKSLSFLHVVLCFSCLGAVPLSSLITAPLTASLSHSSRPFSFIPYSFKILFQFVEWPRLK